MRCFDLHVQPTSQADALHIDQLSGRSFEPLDQQLESAFRSRAVALLQRAVERLDEDRSVAAVLSEIRASTDGRQLEQELTRASIQDAMPAWLLKRRSIARGLRRFVWPKSGMAAVQNRLMNWTYNEQLGLDLGTAPADVSARRIFADYFDYLQWRRGEARIVEGFGALAAGLLAWIRERASQKPGLQLTVDLDVEVLEVGRSDRLSLRFDGPGGVGENAVNAAVVTCPIWRSSISLKSGSGTACSPAHARR